MGVGDPAARSASRWQVKRAATKLEPDRETTFQALVDYPTRAH